MSRRILSSLILLLLFALVAPAQEVEPSSGPAAPAQAEAEITPEEAKQARELAQEFTRRFFDNEDPEGVIPDLFTADFIERYQTAKIKVLKDVGPSVANLFPIDIGDQVIAEAEVDSLRRFHVVAFGLVVNMLRAYLSKCVNDGGDDEADGDCFRTKLITPAVETTLRQSPILASWWDEEVEDLSISSTKDLRDVTATLERVRAQAQAESNEIDFAAVQQMGWYQDWTGNNSGIPWVHIEREEKYGYPAGTRFIYVNTATGLSLVLVPQNDKLKIFWALITDD